ncbi:nitrate reductase subunit beta [Acidithiobacillus ferrooxidans]|uniref:nitrate reductase subunit beta n=1 Tax=Acidithiobacillus ferrooxidans TaxID=920 RepID=UPI000AE5D21C|nr:nitrate reductase subunit beta [Acidithiobacillus ferrooxidans]
MKVRAQFALVFNLDKCIGCHTCSVTCKNTWTNRRGTEYIWFNNVETKPGIGYPKNWENQDQWHGGWILKNGKLSLKQGGRFWELMTIFANPHLPEILDYYEPFTYDYAHLLNAQLSETAPVARPVSLVSGQVMEKIEWSANWEDQLGGTYQTRSVDYNLRDVPGKDLLGEFEKTFLFYLPRMCNHCLNPACVAACPSGAIYKREEDGIVLIDQDRCRGWRMCISACPYKKVYFNWDSGKSEKCIACYPRVESGLPTICSDTCVGRIRYNGIMLYDADRIAELAGTNEEQDLYEAQMNIFLNPHDPEVIAQARLDDVPDSWIDAAQRSPIYKMAMDWKIALPLHPEFRTLPMVWYIPPLSPMGCEISPRNIPSKAEDIIPRLESLRIPIDYLASLFTAGNHKPVIASLKKLIAMRAYQRSLHVQGVPNTEVLDGADLDEATAQDMYRYLAIANYEDRFVIPTSHQETMMDDPYDFQGQNGFVFGNESSVGISAGELFPRRRKETPAANVQPLHFVRHRGNV